MNILSYAGNSAPAHRGHFAYIHMYTSTYIYAHTSIYTYHNMREIVRYIHWWVRILVIAPDKALLAQFRLDTLLSSCPYFVLSPNIHVHI